MLMVLGPHKNRSALKSERGNGKSGHATAQDEVEEERVKPTTRKKDNLASFDPDQI